MDNAQAADFAAKYEAYLEERRKVHQAASTPLPESVRRVAVDDAALFYDPHNCGDWVKVRWCGETPAKTRIGVYIGSIARLLNLDVVDHDDGSKILVAAPALRNPAIFVPSLSRVVFGMESWWGKIKSPDELKEITDEDIDGLWYVQAAKALAAAEHTAEPEQKK